RPFAYALDALCRYAITDEAGPLQSALGELRIPGAKQRLAHTLPPSALLDLGRGRPHAAVAHGGGALRDAQALRPPARNNVAHLVLARACKVMSDATGYERHVAALARLENAPVAAWARGLAVRLEPSRN